MKKICFIFLSVFFFFFSIKDSFGFSSVNLPYPLPYNYNGTSLVDAFVLQVTGQSGNDFVVLYSSSNGNPNNSKAFIGSPSGSTKYGFYHLPYASGTTTCKFICSGGVCPTTPNTCTIASNINPLWSMDLKNFATTKDIIVSPYFDTVNYLGYSNNPPYCYLSLCEDQYNGGQLLLSKNLDSSGNDILPAPDTDSILVPLSGAYVPIGEQTFSGECTEKGLHYAMNWRDFNYPTTPTITCENDYTWSTTYEVLPSTSSTRAYYLYNYETQQSIFVDVFGMDPQTYLWGLSFLYPDVDTSGYAKLKISNNFPFRIKYNLPQGENKNDYDIAIRDTSSGTLIVSYPLSSSDSDSLGYIEKTINVSAGINDLTFFLIKGTEEKFAVSVNWEGVADVGAGVYDSTLPDQQDLGFWGNLVRTLFVPRFGFIDTRLNTMSSDFALHFGNFSELKDSFVSVFSSVSDTGTAPSGSFTWHGWNLNVLNFEMIDDWISTMKGIEIAVLWVLTFFVIFRKLSTIFSV